ncbi:hypothetical protein ACPOL_0700 [Acidisarcina polymorpha]|uniref:Uncharacterized protein n=1 Tax=Acidisarcina polymorpha TaxID=2211140 RepID=A0A2Z5FTB0_9BACT|nr:hypothetical protein ACPOL_0700 [Acidisarcina polymorpha]
MANDKSRSFKSSQCGPQCFLGSRWREPRELAQAYGAKSQRTQYLQRPFTTEKL